MTISRIFQSVPLKENDIITLDSTASHHLARVLRAKIGDAVIIFNGKNGEYQATIHHIDKKSVTVELKKFIDRSAESPLELYLAQGISRGEKMDYTIQKAVELGVKKIFPLITERCNVKLNDERQQKRLQHWGAIVASACEQSGRTELPEMIAPQSLENFLSNCHADFKFVLNPSAEEKLKNYKIPRDAKVILLIGVEGGFSEREILAAKSHQFIDLNLGPRILRTETAAVSALSVLQFYAGDLT